MNTEVSLFIFCIIIVGALLVERYFFAHQVQKEKTKLLDELSKMAKAVISKNASDYVMTTSIDKVPTEEKMPADSDLVAEEGLSDDEFARAIGKEIKE